MPTRCARLWRTKLSSSPSVANSKEDHDDAWIDSLSETTNGGIIRQGALGAHRLDKMTNPTHISQKVNVMKNCSPERLELGPTPEPSSKSSAIESPNTSDTVRSWRYWFGTVGDSRQASPCRLPLRSRDDNMALQEGQPDNSHALVLSLESVANSYASHQQDSNLVCQPRLDVWSFHHLRCSAWRGDERRHWSQWSIRLLLPTVSIHGCAVGCPQSAGYPVADLQVESPAARWSDPRCSAKGHHST